LRGQRRRLRDLLQAGRNVLVSCTLPAGDTLENARGKRNQAMLAADAILHF
jgi:hypothetical protein